MQTGIVAALLLVMFLALDVWRYRREVHPPLNAALAPIRVQGKINFVLILLVISSILGSAAWQPGIAFDVYGTKVQLQNLMRDVGLIAIAMLSLLLTPDTHREANDFTWEPIREVAKLFAGIFIVIIPVLAMLRARQSGAFSWLLSAVSERDGSPQEVAYFWLTGLLSAFLDNVPTYLVFFEVAGGDARELMGPLAGTLASLSMGAVYMGALTYIGNAPNFMVYAIARERGIKMPHFFGYALWAAAVLMPLFVLLTLLPISPILKWS
jgi:Na+/H+ antiporter NhaD/arsenite permease-like protein